MSKLDTQGSLPTPGDLPYPGISEAIAAAIANLSREMQEGFKRVNDRFEEIERTMNISYVFPVVIYPKEALLTAFCTAKPIRVVNTSAIRADSKLEPLVAIATGEPIPNFPATPRELKNLSGMSLIKCFQGYSN
jgi:hypothetical protein